MSVNGIEIPAGRQNRQPASAAGADRGPEGLDGPAAFVVALRRDYVSYLLSLGLVNLGNILLLPLVTAYFAPADLGLYSLVETALTQGATFSLLGLKFAYLYYYAHTPAEDRPGLLGTTLFLAAGAGILAGLALWAVFGNAAIMAHFDAGTLSWGWLMAVQLPLGAVQAVLVTELRASRQIWLSGSIAVARLALTLLLATVMVAGYGAGLPGLLAAQAAAVAATCLLAWRSLGSRVRLHWQPGRAWALARYGLPMMASLMLRYSLDTLSRFALAAFVSIEAAGMFMVANSVASVFESLLALPFFMAWGGLVHHALRQSAAAAIVGRALDIAARLAAILLLAILAARPWLFEWLAHDAMPGAAGLFALLLLARWVQLIRSPLTSGILATGRTGWATRNSLFGLAVFLVLVYPLSVMWGAMGMAAALLAAHTIATTTLTAAAWRHHRPVIAWSSLALCGLVVAGTALSLTPEGNPAILAAMLAGAVALAAFASRAPPDGCATRSPTARPS